MSSTAGTPPATSMALPPASPGLDHPKGGILLNPAPPALRPTISISSVSPSTASTKSPSGSQRIRFAPLPEPRPRSLSTGHNIGWTSGVDEDGNEVRTMEVRNIPQAEVHYDYETASDDDDDEGKMRGRSWSKGMESSLAKGMESSWKMSKKILTAGMWEDKEDKKYDGGMPLKKSVSAGMIGSSPFKWSDDKKRSLPIPSSPGHRRMSSLEPDTTSAALGSSPQPVVKLLNGRVYGARRASEIADMQKKQREASEPAFVEWGNTKQDSTIAPVKSTGFLGDDDDGSGMGWVKRRREERQRKEREEKERKEREESSPEAEKVETPVGVPAELPATPVIHISEPDVMKQAEPVFEEDDDDGDFSSDDEEEEEIDRSTSSAAGIEIMSRHHH